MNCNIKKPVSHRYVELEHGFYIAFLVTSGKVMRVGKADNRADAKKIATEAAAEANRGLPTDVVLHHHNVIRCFSGETLWHR